MPIERIVINSEDAARLTTDRDTVDKTLRIATDKLSIARVTGDYLLVTAVKLAFLCQRLYNELEELRENEAEDGSEQGDVPAEDDRRGAGPGQP